MPPWSWRPVGERAVLIVVGQSGTDRPNPARVADAVRQTAEAAGVALQEVVPGAETVLVVAETVLAAETGLVAETKQGPSPLFGLTALLADAEASLGRGGGPTGSTGDGDLSAADEPSAASDPVLIDVVYDGEDLAEVAAGVGLSPADVIDRHAAGSYVAAFTGFGPGFAYLTGLDPALWLPRRDQARPVVPAGSVAIAERYSAVYPRATPGGWWLLGRTTRIVWDVRRSPPALIRPGDGVRFRSVER